jgi:aspartokinase
MENKEHELFPGQKEHEEEIAWLALVMSQMRSKPEWLSKTIQAACDGVVQISRTATAEINIAALFWASISPKERERLYKKGIDNPRLQQYTREKIGPKDPMDILDQV